MPLYEYECVKCSTHFEKLVYDRNLEVTCRSCGSSDVRQLLSTFAVAAPAEKVSRDLGPCGACGAAQRGACGID